MSQIQLNRQLLEASAHGKRLDVQILIRKGASIHYQIPSNEESLYGARTPLGVAVLCWHPEVAELLIECGANVNVTEDSVSVLMIAAHRNLASTVELLITQGAHLDYRDKNGRTVLQWAIHRNEDCQAMVELLLDAGADINAKDHEGGTALTEATKMKNEAMVELLLLRGADPESILESLN